MARKKKVNSVSLSQRGVSLNSTLLSDSNSTSYTFPWSGGINPNDAVTVSASSFVGSQEATIFSTENFGVARSMRLVFQAQDSPEQQAILLISQSGATANVSPSSLNFTWEGGQQNVVVSTNISDLGLISCSIEGDTLGVFSIGDTVASGSSLTVPIICKGDYAGLSNTSATLSIKVGTLSPILLVLTQEAAPSHIEYGSWAFDCYMGSVGSKSYAFSAGGSTSGVDLVIAEPQRSYEVVYDNPVLNTSGIQYAHELYPNSAFGVTISSGFPVFSLRSTSVGVTGGRVPVACQSAGAKEGPQVDGSVSVSILLGQDTLTSTISLSRDPNNIESQGLTMNPASLSSIPAGPGAQRIEIVFAYGVSYSSGVSDALDVSADVIPVLSDSVEWASLSKNVLVVSDRGTTPGAERSVTVSASYQGASVSGSFTQVANDIVSATGTLGALQLSSGGSVLTSLPAAGMLASVSVPPTLVQRFTSGSSLSVPSSSLNVSLQYPQNAGSAPLTTSLLGGSGSVPVYFNYTPAQRDLLFTATFSYDDPSSPGNSTVTLSKSLVLPQVVGFIEFDPSQSFTNVDPTVQQFTFRFKTDLPIDGIVASPPGSPDPSVPDRYTTATISSSMSDGWYVGQCSGLSEYHDVVEGHIVLTAIDVNVHS